MAPTPIQNLPNLLNLPRELLHHIEQLTPRDIPLESIPSRTLSAIKRQYSTVAIPATYAGINDGPSAGVVVGIVLGSIAGFILVCWLLWTLANFGGRGGVMAESVQVVREPERSTHSHSRRSRRSHRHTAVMRERSRSPLPPPPRNETIIVEERHRTSVPPPPPPMQRETIIVEERREPRVEGDDMVEVIEEESISVSPDRRPPRREAQGGAGGADSDKFNTLVIRHPPPPSVRRPRSSGIPQTPETKGFYFAEKHAQSEIPTSDHRLHHQIIGCFAFWWSFGFAHFCALPRESAPSLLVSHSVGEAHRLSPSTLTPLPAHSYALL